MQSRKPAKRARKSAASTNENEQPIRQQVAEKVEAKLAAKNAVGKTEAARKHASTGKPTAASKAAAKRVTRRRKAEKTAAALKQTIAQSECERRIREAAEANAKFRTMFEQGVHFAGILTREGSVVEANHFSLDACGYRREEVIGRPFWECGWWNRCAELKTLVQTGTRLAADGQIFRRETNYFLADGGERFVDLTIAPVTDEAGQVIFISATGIDITERKRAEQALTASEERLRFLDHLGEQTRAAVDPETVMQVTAGALAEYLKATGCIYADVESDSDRFTIRHDCAPEPARHRAGVYDLARLGTKALHDLRAGRTHVVTNVDTQLADEDSSNLLKAFEVKAAIWYPLVKQGQLVALMSVDQDAPRQWTAAEIAIVEQVAERCWAHIERVRSAIALTAADRHKDEFLATLAHELRNPLAPLRNGLQILRLAEHDIARRHEIQGMMERQLGQMVRLIDDLLDISRISRNKLDLQLERIDLASVIENAIEGSRPHIDAALHELQVELPREPVFVMADFTRLSQAILNLLNNSAKYTPSRGRIRIAAAVDGDAVAIVVEDTGIGIPAEALSHIFTMFGQVDRAIERATGGLGIGLSLVKGLVEMHGGTVVAHSDGPRRGARFTVRLPIAVQAASPAAALPKAAGEHARRRVLIVDDNRDAAKTLAQVLGIMGDETLLAHDGLEAVEKACATQPDLVLMDIGMPKLNGYEATRRIRSLLPDKPMIIIALTGWGQAEDKRLAAASGCDGHLVKPVSLFDLQSLIAEISDPR
ncbi:MAG: ATP-binding protein [Aureliella sp.]